MAIEPPATRTRVVTLVDELGLTTIQARLKVSSRSHHERNLASYAGDPQPFKPKVERLLNNFIR